ncbi:phosphatidate cytidylyltransferase [Acuticoccus sp. M5D2P5]|uniref:phosphatidate cytidylyltransferase n=1 Tax=Acuticoccus kalidii TaxID=2910977 RepID=UPI001F400002|nr:phosphatidate cytidylyltransferase [Acuticoccus kalidii]MCF3935882.1 phosphatidate cytidylyltransferase [Acuticoccus kalidii]
MFTASPLLIGFASILALLIAGTIASFWMAGIRARVKTWWVIVVALGAAMLAGRMGVIVLFALISFIALREYLSLVPTRREDRPALLLAYALVPASYLIVALDWYGIYLVFVPVYVFLLMPAVLVLNGRTKGYLAATGILHWGIVITVYNLGYGALFMNTPPAEAPLGGAGLLFFLLVVTGLNDVFQYIAGRTIGGPKILPSVSPNKTWAGFLGGVVLSGILVCLLAPIFTPLPWRAILILAVLMPVAGFAGDVTMSAVKRDLGVKDASKLLPGHGGALDRLDSLTFTAPLTFHVFAFFSSVRF